MFICNFCSKVCKNNNSFRNHERMCSRNPNRQIGWVEANKEETKIRTDKGKKSNGFLKAKELGLPYETTAAVRKKISESSSQRRHSEETKKKLSEGKIQYYKDNPDKIPYKLWHSSEESYPEKYFREIFEKENLEFKPQLPVSIYALDFAFTSSMIDFEVNGDTHYKPKVIKKDRRRREFLESKGWTVIELFWSDYQKLDDDLKLLVVSDILDKVGVNGN